MIISIKEDTKSIKLLPNVIQLYDPEDKAVVLVSKDVYDQCLLLSAKFNGDAKPVKEACKSATTNALVNVPGAQEFTSLLQSPIPKPLDILLPALYLFPDIPGMSFEGMARKDFYLLMNQLTLMIDFYAFCTTPEQFRKQFSMPYHLLANLDAVEAELLERVTFKEPVYFNQPAQPAQPQISMQAQTVPQIGYSTEPVQTSTPVVESTPEVKESEPDAEGTSMVEIDWDSILDDIKKSQGNKDKEEDDITEEESVTVSTSRPEPTPAEEQIAKEKFGIKDATQEDIKETATVLNKFCGGVF